MEHNEPQFDNETISFKQLVDNAMEWIRYFRSKWMIIFIAVIIGGLIGFLRVFRQKPIYTARLTFALEGENSGGGLGGALGIASSFGFDLGSGPSGAFSSSNLVELMRSRKMVEQTLLSTVTINGKQLSLAEMYIEFNDLRSTWEKSNPALNRQLQFRPDADRNSFTIAQDSVLNEIFTSLVEDNLVVKPIDKKVSILSIEVRSPNELFAKLFVEKLALKVMDFYVETNSKKAKLNLAILKQQVDSVRSELNNAITGVAVANDNAFNLNPALNINRTPSSRRQIDVQANSAMLTELVKNLEIAKVTLRKETPLIQIIDNPILPLKKDKPSTIRYTFVSAFLAGLLCCIVLFIRRWVAKALS